jgi:muramoyltetrapeptide carboxypeptidase
VPGYDSGFGMPSVVQWLRAQTKTPILTGLPFGHVPTKVCLPVGATVSLNTEGRDALMFWGD